LEGGADGYVVAGGGFILFFCKHDSAPCPVLPRLTAAEGALTFFQVCLYFYRPSSLLRRFLDKKVTKTQGLDLMSDKFVKALLVVSTSSDEGSERAR